MSVRRLLLTSAVMVATALGVSALAPPPAAALLTVLDAQQVADTAGPDVVVLALAGLAAWAVWTWGAVGLALTAASALPGVAGRTAALATRIVLPAGLRSGAALALGVGLGLTAPAVAYAAAPGEPVGASASGAPDWPTGSATEPVVPAEAAPPPDWPRSGTPSAVAHVVATGDCLWRIVAARSAAAGTPASDAEVAAGVHDWWTANESVIGPDPDLILPGQVLRAPAP